MNAGSDTFPVLATRICGVSPSVVIRNGGGYLTRNDTFAPVALALPCPGRLAQLDPYHAGGTTRPATATPRPVCQYGMIAYAKAKVW